MFFDDYTVCFNAGWNTQAILFLITTSMNFMDCYKIVVKTLLDWTQWDALIAKFKTPNSIKTLADLFDQCVDSNDETV